MLSRVLNAKFVPTSFDAALLLLRVGSGAILFLKHGWVNVSPFSLNSPPADFPNLFHLGFGICSLLIIIGFGTRWAAVFSFCALFAAWNFQHHFRFFGSMRSGTGSVNSLYGEMITQFLVFMIVFIVGGPGRYSVDSLLERKV